MGNNRISLREAIKFHGHLGPYLVLGLLAGEFAIKETGAKKYFGLEVSVRGANKRPKSCFIDGLQLSTGATFGKGNIKKLSAGSIKVLFRNTEDNRKVYLFLDEGLVKRLDSLKGHADSEAFARKLYKDKPSNIFKLGR